MEFKIAKIISSVFHPLWMPTLGVFLVFQSNIYLAYTTSPTVKEMIYLLTFFNTAFIPGLMAFFLYKKKLIKSLEMRDKKERWFPFLMTAVFYGFTYVLFRKAGFSPILLSLLAGATLSVVCALLISVKWKISTHMVGLGGVIGVVFAISRMFMVEAIVLLLPLVFVAGVVAFARLKLNAHCPSEIYTGVVLGFLCEFIALNYNIAGLIG